MTEPENGAPAHGDEPASSSLAGRNLVAGDQARDALREQLGLTAAHRSPHLLRGVAWQAGQLKLSVAGPGYGVTQVWLKPAAAPGAFCRCQHLSIAYGGRGPAHPALVQLLRHLQARLEHVTLDALLRPLLDDPRTKGLGNDAAPAAPPAVAAAEQRPPAEAPPTPEPPAARTAPARGDKVPRWGHHWSPAPGQLGRWGLFFDDDAFEFCTLNQINILYPVVHIVHGEHECLFVAPRHATRFRWFHNTPDLRDAPRPVGAAVRRRLGLPPQPAVDFRRLSTDMTEMDVIRGARAKLERVVAEAGRGERERIVSLDNTCLPEAMGEDVDATCAPLSRDDRVHWCPHALGYTHDRALYLEEETFTGGSESRLLQRLLVPGPPAADDSRRRYNLVGFPDGPATEELVGLLEAGGAHLNALLLPDVDVEAFRRAPPASTQVFYPNAWMAPLFRSVIEPLAPRAVHRAAPFGFRGTRAWVEEVAAALGCAAPTGARCDEAVARLQPRWERLRAAARDQRLAWVVDPRVAEKLRLAEAFWGLPAIEVVTEMGFGVDVLAFAPAGDASYAADLPTLAADPAQVTVRPFRSPDELDDALRGVAAVYSDYFFERRAARSGTGWFSFLDFEIGFAGALRTLERLLRVATTPFYRRYSTYLRSGPQPS